MQDKARQIELYGQRYRDVVNGLAQAFEIAGGIKPSMMPVMILVCRKPWKKILT